VELYKMSAGENMDKVREASTSTSVSLTISTLLEKTLGLESRRHLHGAL
jgi:hypothetical protein